MPMRLLDLARKNPVDLMISSSSSGFAAASASGVGYRSEERRRDHVHAPIGALRAQDGRDEELERRLEVEGAVRIRIVLGESSVDDRGIFRRRCSFDGPLFSCAFVAARFFVGFLAASA